VHLLEGELGCIITFETVVFSSIANFLLLFAHGHTAWTFNKKGLC
jgi:hypothetical protein